MEPVTAVLSGVVIAVVSGAVVRVVGNGGKVSDDKCIERRESCSALVCSEMKHVKEGINDIKDTLTKMNNRK